MRPVEQSRIGKRGTCFRSCIASILNLREQDVPDWPRANDDPGVNRWLGRRGLRYDQVPIVPGAPPPVGWHTIEGTSPRGGQHAVVGYNGKFVHDPHPKSDDPRRGLVAPQYWGLLTPVARAKDAVMYVVENEDGTAQAIIRDGRFVGWTKRGNVVTKEVAHAVAQAVGGTPVVTARGHALGRIERFGSKRLRDAVTLRPDKDGEMQLTYTARDAFTAAAHHVLDAPRSLERRRGR